MIESYETIGKPKDIPSDEGGEPLNRMKCGSSSFLKYLNEKTNIILSEEQIDMVRRAFNKMESQGKMDLIYFEMQLMLSKMPSFSIAERSNISTALDLYLMRSD